MICKKGDTMKQQRRNARQITEEQKIHADDEHALPFYRFYGMRREIRAWREKLAIWIGRALVIFLLATFAAIVGALSVAFFLYFPELWIKLLVALSVAIFLALTLTRRLRMRKKFCRRLKKLCRETKCKLRFRPKFIRSAKGLPNREDVRIESGSCIYYLRYINTKKYGVSVYLESDGQVKIVKKPLRNKFTLIFNLQPKVTYYPVKMPLPEHGSKRVLCGFVVDPICQSMYYKQKDGGYEATGNGGEHFGVTVYTVNGLFETIRYDSTHQKREIRY